MSENQTTPAGVQVGQVWTPRRASEQPRTITEVNPFYNLIFYTKASGWPHVAGPEQFAKWAARVGAQPREASDAG